MYLIAQIRVLITVLVLASCAPYGFDADHPSHLALSLFVGRRTRVAAAQQFDVANGNRVDAARAHRDLGAVASGRLDLRESLHRVWISLYQSNEQRGLSVRLRTPLLPILQGSDVCS